MFLRLPRAFALMLGSFALGSLAVAVDGCGSDSKDPIAGDGSTTTDSPGSKPDGAKPEDDGSVGDGAADSAIDGAGDGAAVGKGETCIGFAKGTPCGANGLPDYGYVCFNGSPPGIAGCKLATSSAFGETYCCTENKCVAQPDQDKTCKAAGTHHRYQCPPEGDAGSVAPPVGCADAGSGGSALERFYCCP